MQYTKIVHIGIISVICLVVATVFFVQKLRLFHAGPQRCAGGTSLNIVAHQDDDILFMNPDLMRDIQANICVVTVYMTAGDANLGKDYWQEREEGPKAAYALMADSTNDWTRKDIQISNHSIPQYYLTKNPTIRLIFMRLPDGSTDGSGYSSHNNESLSRLWDKTIKEIHPVDNSNPYTMPDLMETIEYIINVSKPSVVRSLNPTTKDALDDHADHTISAQVTQLAIRQHPPTYKSVWYQGYVINELPTNLSQPDANLKQNVFLEYAKYDPKTCQSTAQCQTTRIYGWFSRQYVTQ